MRTFLLSLLLLSACADPDIEFGARPLEAEENPEIVVRYAEGVRDGDSSQPFLVTVDCEPALILLEEEQALLVFNTWRTADADYFGFTYDDGSAELFRMQFDRAQALLHYGLDDDEYDLGAGDVTRRLTPTDPNIQHTGQWAAEKIVGISADCTP